MALMVALMMFNNDVADMASMDLGAFPEVPTPLCISSSTLTKENKYRTK
jgi:hypothetical protein